MSDSNEILGYDAALLLEQYQNYISELISLGSSDIQAKEQADIKFKEQLEFIRQHSDIPRQFIYPTQHLSNFQTLDRSLQIFGKEYDVIKKAFWYFTFSLPLQEKIVSLGNISTDCRIHLSIPLPSGAGKKNIVKVAEEISKRFGLNVAKPTSFHPEQLVGKTIRRRSGRNQSVFEQIPGHLSDNVVLFDEAVELINSTDQSYKESRKYLIEALDYYPNNKIAKKMVDVPREDQLEYTPVCNVVLFFQPYSVPEHVLLLGFFRRFLVVYTKVKQEDFSEYYEERVNGSYDIKKDDLEKLIARLTEIKQRIKSFQIKDEAKERFIDLHRELILQGRTHSKKGNNYTNIMDFTLQDMLLKMSAVQAASRLSEVIEARDVELAYIDLAEFFESELEFVQFKVYGELDYGEDWLGAREEDRECLIWLFQNGATSEVTSSITIQDYCVQISDIFGVGEDMATKHYYRHKERGWIDSRQVGQHNSKVWLKFKPKGNKGSNGSNVLSKNFYNTEYNKIIEKLDSDKNKTQITQSSLLPLLPSEGEGKADENQKLINLEEKILESLPLGTEFNFSEWEQNTINNNSLGSPSDLRNSFWEFVKKWEKENKIYYPRDGVVARRY